MPGEYPGQSNDFCMGRGSGACIFKDREETFGIVSEGRDIRQTGVKIPEMVTWKYFVGW